MLRRGVRESPELRKGPGVTLVVSLGITAISLVTPVLVQQVFDHGFTPEFKPRFVYGICFLAFVLVIMVPGGTDRRTPASCERRRRRS